MKREDFYFNLPQELIAQYPLEQRSDSRLLTYCKNTNTYGHHQFKNVVDFLNPGDLLVMNDSKVLQARLYGFKQTGGRVEFLIERILDELTFLSHIKASKSLKPGTHILLEQEKIIEVLGREGDLFVCKSSMPILDLLNLLGHIPLPPYIKRQDELLDKTRYQTIYAESLGSVAAPTAGLHFDEGVLTSLKNRGVNVGYLTLHVGAGTFKPVQCESIFDHKMHLEHYCISQSLCDSILATKVAGNRVIAVGTTTLRSLESSARLGPLAPIHGQTDIFIYPGFEFKICDGLLTNFHLPESTLLMLVSAFIGYEQTMALYKEAIAKKYRFFSYGDASLLL